MIPIAKEKIIMELGDSIFARNLIVFEKLGSTNTYAIEMAEDGEPEGSVVITEEQSSGRGRMGRAWLSPKYSNLLMSVILRPEFEVRGVFTLNMVMALSVTDAIYELFGIRTGIKWPNDIYLYGKKLGGLLTEISTKGKRVEYAVVGLGLNVNWKPEDIAGMRYSAICLRDEVGSEVPREKIICSILSNLKSYLHMLCMGQLGRLYELWSKQSIVLGKMVDIDMGKEIISGRIIGIDRFGTVTLKDASGRKRNVLYGDVSLKEMKHESSDYRKNSK